MLQAKILTYCDFNLYLYELLSLKHTLNYFYVIAAHWTNVCMYILHLQSSL